VVTLLKSWRSVCVRQPASCLPCPAAFPDPKLHTPVSIPRLHGTRSLSNIPIFSSGRGKDARAPPPPTF
jgi:hypothetical protein